MTLIMLPLVVSAVLVAFNGCDLEYLGFWGVLQSGPFIHWVMTDDIGTLIITPLIINLVMVGLAFWFKDKNWKTNTGLCLSVLVWYGIAVCVFLNNLVIA